MNDGDRNIPTLEDGIRVLELVAERRWKKGFSRSIIRDVIKILRKLQQDGHYEL